jgi:hypothetical protein
MSDLPPAALPADLYIDFKGWRFRPPFHCMYCGVEVDPLQWAYSRSCGGCDVGQSHTRRLNVFERRIFAGPHELVDPSAEHFIPEECFLPLSNIEKYPVIDPPNPIRMPVLPPFFPSGGFSRGCDQMDAQRTLGRVCNCTCLHTVHPVANHSYGCPDNTLAPVRAEE